MQKKEVTKGSKEGFGYIEKSNINDQKLYKMWIILIDITNKKKYWLHIKYHVR